MVAAHHENIVLAFETSCDDTCAAVLKASGGAPPLRKGELVVLSNVVSSQIDIHKLYGGVVPEIASRNHALSIQTVFEEALERAGVGLEQVTCVAATVEPGLRGCVMVGRVFGESLATARGVEFIGVNHLAGHIASVALTHPDVRPPFLALVVSGGHTALYKVESWGGEPEVLCETSDDACGEAFDKVAKMLGLGLPGGVMIEQQAGKCTAAEPMTFVKKPSFHKGSFSYSGLKTAVLNYLNRLGQRGEAVDVPFVAASFQHEAVEQLVVKCVQHIRKHGILTLCVSGGVSANRYLRKRLAEECRKLGARVLFPDFKYCTDNAAMIGAAAILSKSGENV